MGTWQPVCILERQVGPFTVVRSGHRKADCLVCRYKLVVAH